MVAAKKVSKVAFGGVFLGVTILFLYLSFVFPTGKLTWVALSCFSSSFAMLELGNKYIAPFWIAGLMVGFLVVGLSPAYLIFALFSLPLGVLKIPVDRVKNIGWRYLIKFFIFNLGCGVYILFFQSILNMNLERLLGLNFNLNFGILLLVLNLVFFAFDYLQTKVIEYYIFKVRSKLKIGD